LLKYFLVYLIKHPNFDLMHSFSFSRFVFDEFIANGREYVHKVGKTITNHMVERRNMINIYLRGRACIESVRESFDSGGVFEFVSLSFFLLFSSVYRFSSVLLALRFFFLLGDPLELFFNFCSSCCASWGLRFEI
jgi:hypothetical protein